MNEIKQNSPYAWFLAARPKTLTGAIIPVLLGSALAFSDGQFKTAPALLCALFACGMQIAYHTADGYTKAVYYPIAGTAELFFNWADTTDTAEALPESLTISLKDQAPEGFDGRIRISFVIEDMPAWSAAKVQIRSAA